ncbi:anti-sigma factor family protein [Nonomuraea sp. SBT364]|uniref:anti-sigma factor family protein n=1 Tax=Nonomuraea sp. SBT364 TaxID=1580530 RepID=UPI0007C6974B|nr:zf-HC2 domain-containing protein [Nonomuraea sp. SBT364]
MTARVEHTDVGAYALGLLEDDDRRAFEHHLSRCRSCAVELAELSGVAHALTGLGPLEDDPPPGEEPAEVIDLLRRKRAADRRARRSTFLVGVAAAVTLVAGGLVVGAQFGGGAPASPVASPVAPPHDGIGPAEQFYAMGTPVEGVGTGGVTGGLVLESKGWGTHAALKLSGVKGPLECALIAVADDGDRRIMMGWAVPAAGYGVPGSPGPLYVHGASALPLDRIDHFEVVTTEGANLLTVKV